MTEPNPESVKLIAEYNVSAVFRQLTESDTIVGRGYQVAGFASVVLALASVGDGGDGWLTAIVCVYLATLAACFVVLIPRNYYTPGAPDKLWKMHWNLPPDAARRWLIDVSVDAYELNRTATRNRVWALIAAVVGLAIQTVLVGVRLL